MAIISFIFSVVIGLILMIMLKNISTGRFAVLVSLHGILLFAWLASLLLSGKQGTSEYFNYFFMFFICSGILLSGIAVRSSFTLPVKIYFSLYALTIPMFIFSPSMLVYFLLTSHYTDSLGPSFHAGGNYFVETQSTVMKADSFPHYKLVRKRGLYNHTICRDIIFNGTLDSIHVLKINPGVQIIVRGFTSKVTYVSSGVDSLDKDLDLSPHKIDDVEYHL